MITLTFGTNSWDFFSWQAAADFVQDKVKNVQEKDEITCFEDLDFHELTEEEISNEMKKEIDEIRAMDPSEFISI